MSIREVVLDHHQWVGPLIACCIMSRLRQNNPRKVLHLFEIPCYIPLSRVIQPTRCFLKRCFILPVYILQHLLIPNDPVQSIKLPDIPQHRHILSHQVLHKSNRGCHLGPCHCVSHRSTFPLKFISFRRPSDMERCKHLGWIIAI